MVKALMALHHFLCGFPKLGKPLRKRVHFLVGQPLRKELFLASLNNLVWIGNNSGNQTIMCEEPSELFETFVILEEIKIMNYSRLNVIC